MKLNLALESKNRYHTCAFTKIINQEIKNLTQIKGGVMENKKFWIRHSVKNFVLGAFDPIFSAII